MTNRIKKILILLFLLNFTFVQAGSMFAADGPDPVDPPDPPEIQTTADGPDPVDPPDPPEPTEAPVSSDNGDEVRDNNPNDPIITTQDNTQGDAYQGILSDGNVGNTFIDTGDVNSNGNIFTTANSNISEGGNCCGNGGIGVINDGNGSGSSNTGSATVSENNTTDQSNSASISNGLTGASVSGQNSASNNTGGDSFIDTGNASTTGTIITSANTNIDGVTVAEFNIVDDHVGDYILDFGAGCVSGCDGFTGLAQNSNNGSNSNNNASINSDTNNITNQINDGVVNNDLYLTSDSGNNTASGNTGGDSYVTTGDASVAGNVLTFLNNNLAGNVILGVVNIFGDLIGDIILPESALNAFACATCGGSTALVNSGNGSNSDNNASSDQAIIDTITQVNVADIDNNLILDANTGGNSASGNTGGDVYITTGNADVTAQVLNIANTNIIGGNWWLVIINRAVQWIGQIVGAPQGAVFAGSSGTEFAVDENGQITAINNGNGAGSVNYASVNSNTNNTTNQTNNAEVNNNIYLSANTGKNLANDNTGGDNYITTGDSKVIANLVNFVNNNIVGGKLLVTFVNVFGNWFGDFVTPGTHKENNNAGIGGEQVASVPGSSNSQSSNSSQNGGNPNPNGSNPSSNSIPFAGGVIAGLTIGRNILAISTESLQNSDDTQILGVNNIVKDNKTDKVNINLAWVILLVPILGVGFILRRKASLFLGRIIR